MAQYDHDELRARILGKGDAYNGNEAHMNRDILDSLVMPRWDDLRFPSQSLNLPGGGTNNPGRSNTTGLLLFDDDRQETVAGVAQMPHTWIEGSVLRPHVHWIQDEPGDVVWRFEYQLLSNGGSYATIGDYTVTEHTATAFTYTSDNLTQITPLGDLDMTGRLASVIILWRLSRMGADAADTMPGDAQFLEFDIHYQTHGGGTIDEYPGA